MTLFLIVIIGALFFWWFDSTNAKTKMDDYREKTKGSRQVEKEEWGKYIRLLCDEYCELAKTKVDFESVGLNPFRVTINYGEIYETSQLQLSSCYFEVFGTYQRPMFDKKYDSIPMFTDRHILEQLRIKHGLPSDTELNGTIYGNRDGSTNYKSLHDIIEKCVFRAVKQRGYRHGGIDYVAQRQRELNLKALEEKYDYYNHNKKK